MPVHLVVNLYTFFQKTPSAKPFAEGVFCCDNSVSHGAVIPHKNDLEFRKVFLGNTQCKKKQSFAEILCGYVLVVCRLQ